MSKCMTVDDIIKKENTDHIEVESLSAAKDVVGCILEEALHSAVIDSDRGYMIGDFTEDFSQQFGQVSLSESTSSNLTEGQPSVSDNELNSDRQIEQNSDPPNLDSDNRKSNVKEYRVIDDHLLENNELRIENGSIHLQINKTVKPVDELRNEYFSKEDIIKDEKIEIEYFSGGKLNKIYVPINKENPENQSSTDAQKLVNSDVSLANEKSASFPPISSEELRQSILQVWENVNPQAASGWEGDAFNQPEEIVKVMEKLSGLQVLSNDPNRPRAYTLVEEEVKKMIKEIEEINFNNQCSVSTENPEGYSVSGQGDYENEIESKILYENLDESAESCNVNPHQGSNDNLDSTETLLNTTFIHEEHLEVDQTGNDLVHMDVNLNESAALQSPYTLEGYKTWIDEAQGFHLESGSVEDISSPGLGGVYIKQYSDDTDSGRVFASQKFNETYDFGVNEGVIGMPLTMSNEDLINNSESVIQIIDPTEEESAEISFSLLNEMKLQDYYKNLELADYDYDYPLTMNSDRKLRDSDIVDPRRVKSGMTTVGPLKNLDHDPRDLSGPEVDFGKMTIISGSQEMGKESFSDGISPNNVVILCESDEEGLVEADGRYVTTANLINHDITSLTKLQKIREAISHQQKSVEEISNESQLARAKLDLKDIESASDNRYKDLPAPLSGFKIEAGETRSNEIDILQSVPLVLKESQDNSGYFAGNSPRNSDSNRNLHVYGRSSPVITEQMMDEKLLKAQSTKTILKNKKEENAILNLMDGTQKDMETRYSSNPEDRQEHVFHFNENVQSDMVVNKKHNTLSNVFRKASNKFMRKDSDSFLRNAKSLPRDTSKLHFSLSGAESIKSLLDDCQSSAANVIKKSRSLLKSTQSLLKTISHTKVSDDAANMEKRKSTSCEIELKDGEDRPSTSPKKEELTRSKSSIKSIIMKPFKSSDNLTTPADNRDVPHEHKGLSLILKNCKDYRVEKIEKVRKLLPKTSLFNKSQTTFGNSNEDDNVAANANAEGKTHVGESVEISCQSSEPTIESANIEAEITNTSYTSWIGDRGDVQLPVSRLSEEVSLEEESTDWVEEVVEDDVQDDTGIKSETFTGEGTSEDTASSLTFTINEDDNSPSKKLSNTTFETKAEISHHSFPPESDNDPDLIIETEPYEPGEMVEIPLNEPEISNVDIKLSVERGNITFEPQKDIEVISSATTEGSRGARKWTLPLSTDLKETCSRGSLRNKDKTLSGNPSDIKKRKKNKKLTTRIRSFWLSAFGRSKSPTKKQDAA